jgi:hypothetical protein
LIADFDRHHPCFVPLAFSRFRVEGGAGIGTGQQLKDDRPWAAASHGSDLDTRIGSGEDQPEQTLGTDEAGP